MKKSIEQLILYSTRAFYPMHWEAFKFICKHYLVKGTIIVDRPPEIPSVHQQLGWIDPQREARDLGIEIYSMPESDRSTKTRWLTQKLQELNPDAIWVQEEPTDYFLLQILRFYWFASKPRIITAVCENIFPRKSLPKQWLRQILWRRLNGLIAVATPSIEGIRSAGLPESVPAMTLVAGNQSPPEHLEPYPLPFSRSPRDFIIGFVGRICEEKGWKVLLEAARSLPADYKYMIAGDGEQIGELKEWMKSPDLVDRVFYVGLLPKAELWRFYKNLDCLVVPSLTFPGWKEQFGGVLADAMAMGIPSIGSDSAAIPEVLGDSGLITPEGDPVALAGAIEKLSANPTLREQLSTNGKKRFDREFTISKYARKIATVLQLESCEESIQYDESLSIKP